MSEPIIAETINLLIKQRCEDTNNISDGYHTFGELYEHRIELFITLCEFVDGTTRKPVWMSKKHSDGTEWDGWFILGIGEKIGQQITYHLPVSYWDRLVKYGFEVLPQAVNYDGHTSADVLKRLTEI